VYTQRVSDCVRSEKKDDVEEELPGHSQQLVRPQLKGTYLVLEQA